MMSNTQRTIRSIAIAIAIEALTATSVSLAGEIRDYSESCESALALSAAPKHLWSGAGVYVLGTSGYELTRESSNGFHCIVERNHPDSIIPQCFDEGSVDANLAVIIDEGKLIRDGMSFEDLGKRREKVLKTDQYPVASHGIVYMISDYNYIYNRNGDFLLKADPHLMFHAPDLSEADIGTDFNEAVSNRGMPMLNAEGRHGFIISFVERASDSNAVESACAGQLPSKEKLRPFPPEAPGD